MAPRRDIQFSFKAGDPEVRSRIEAVARGARLPADRERDMQAMAQFALEMADDIDMLISVIEALAEVGIFQATPRPPRS